MILSLQWCLCVCKATTNISCSIVLAFAVSAGVSKDSQSPSHLPNCHQTCMSSTSR